MMMTSRMSADDVSLPARDADGPWPGVLTGVLNPAAVPIRFRRGQKLAPVGATGENVYVVRSGLLIAQAMPRDERNQILAIFYPGDVFRAALMPALPGLALTAVAQSGDAWRVAWPALVAAAGGNRRVGELLIERFAHQSARLAMHAAIIGGLAGDERVIALLIELALRLGTPAAGGIAVELPLSRGDVADYLALNPDTVSRIFSRLRARDILVQSSREHLVVRDMAALKAECSIAEALEALHTPGAPA